MKIFLETEHLILGFFTEADVDELVELDADTDVMLFINGGTATPSSDIENDILPAFLSYYSRFAGYGFWAAAEKSSGQFVGWFQFRPPHGGVLDEAELGYRLRKAAWGKGYATEGARALIENGFTECGVQRVVASTRIAHAASRRVMEKSGLKLVRTFLDPHPERVEEDAQGNVEYGLTRAEWESTRKLTTETLVQGVADGLVQ